MTKTTQEEIKDKTRTVRFITAFKYYEKMLKAVNGITFMYDAFWNGTNNEKPSLPIAFFQIEKVTEDMVSEVQTKKMLFYNSQVEDSPAVANASIVNVVADNIVTKPKAYRIEAIVPRANNVLFFNSPYVQGNQVGSVTNFAFGIKNKANEVMSSIYKWTQLIISILQSILDVAMTMNFSSGSIFKSILETPMYNKNSILYMWENRRIIKLKLSESWDYKYVAITNVSFHKDPTEDDVERATITCTEVPMMIMYPKKSLGTKKKKNFAVTNFVGNTIKTVVETLEGSVE